MIFSNLGFCKAFLLGPKESAFLVAKLLCFVYFMNPSSTSGGNGLIFGTINSSFMFKSSSTMAGAAANSVPVAELPPAEVVVHPWRAMLRQRGLPTLRYLAKTEVHTFAFSVAANAILSFFPFVVLLMWLVRRVFHSQAMYEVIIDLLKNQLPTNQDFVVTNLAHLVNARHGIRFVAAVILLISSSGVFLPLEVAFNRIWGFDKNRSYLGNQLISFVLAFACGTLGLLSVGMAAGNRLFLAFLMGGNQQNFFFKAVGFVLMKLFSMLATVGIFFLIYWLLPNGKVPARRLFRAAVAVGIVWEVSKYVYILALPWLNFQEVYGPFAISVTLMIWAFISGMLVLAGAHLAAIPAVNPDRQAPVQPALPAL
jgi:membrane protein